MTLTANQIKQANLIKEAIERSAVYWVEDILGEKAWSKQYEVMQALDTHRVVTVRACHDTGKSWTAARAVSRFIVPRPSSVAVTTAPTFRQVENILWRELRAMYDESKTPLGGEMLKTQWEFAPDWYALGASTSEPDKIAGIHPKSGYIVVVIDEASGVNEAVFNAIEGMLTSAHARLLLIGNPTSVSGTFFDSHHKWTHAYKIHIGCFDTPNFTNNGIKTIEDLLAVDMDTVEIVAPHLITPQWAKEKYYQWGYDSPMFQARVLGEFPSEEANTIIPLNFVESASTDERREIVPLGDPKIGADIARYGDDETVITYRLGLNVREQVISRKEDTAQTAGRIKQYDSPRPVFIGVDVDGLGAGVADMLRSDGIDSVADIHNNAKAIPDETGLTFANLITQIWWHARELFINGEIAIPDDEDLKSQLSSRRYKMTRQGIAIESKDDYKKRMNGKSPDRADSLMYSLADFIIENVNTVKSVVAKKSRERYNKAREDFENLR